MSTEIDYINHVVIGAGINVNQDTFSDDIKATASSLKPVSYTHLLRHGYKLKVVNTKPDQINQSMHYNPLLYLQDSTSIMQVVNLLVENTSGNAEAEKEDFFVKAERQLYMALMGYLFYCLLYTSRCV